MGDKLNIGFIGNFEGASYTTENDRTWSFEKLGHKVFKFQENTTTAEHLINIMSEIDMLVYSHTHDPSYVIDGLLKVFEAYRNNGVPTVSVHLDRWMGLKRVEDMGKEATWFTEHIFMADGSPEARLKYNELQLNWHWLKPAVIERDCYMALPDKKKFPHDIIFTGSKGYHPEYPFRPLLIDFLHKTYGDKFGHYGNDGIKVVRENELNQLYASSKIVVGDSCFGGRPRYVSDRYYEVRGRGGFLMHPKTLDIDNYGVGHYLKEDLEHLKRNIDYWLVHDQEREMKRVEGHKWVKKHETYTHRANEIIAKVFNDY